MLRSVRAGKRVTLADVGLFSDGTAVKLVGEETFRLARQLVDDFVVVDTDAVCAAIKDDVFQDTRSILEPPARWAWPPIKQYAEQPGAKVKGETFVAITSGANMNFDRLRFVAERAEVGEQREAIFASRSPRSAAASGASASWSAARRHRVQLPHLRPERGHVFVGVAIANRDESTKIARATSSATVSHAGPDDDELAKLHLRHLVGGRSDLGAGRAPVPLHLPERPGALMRFSPACTRAGTSACSTTATRAPTTAASWSASRYRRPTRRLSVNSWRRSPTPRGRDRQSRVPHVPALTHTRRRRSDCATSMSVNRSLITPTANPLLEQALREKLQRRSEPRAAWRARAAGGAPGPDPEHAQTRASARRSWCCSPTTAWRSTASACPARLDGTKMVAACSARSCRCRCSRASRAWSCRWSTPHRRADGAAPRLLARKIAHGTRSSRAPAMAMSVDQAHAAIRAGMEIGDSLPGNAIACARRSASARTSAALVLSRLTESPVPGAALRPAR